MNRKFIGLSMILFILGSIMIIADVVFAETYFSDDFENFPDGWTVSSNGAGAITKSNTQFYEGSYSCRVYSPNLSDRAYAVQDITEITENHHLELFIYIDSSIQPSTCQVILVYDVSLGSASFYIRLDYHDSGYYLTEYAQDISEVSANQWIEIDGYFNVTSSKINYYIDGDYKGEFTAYYSGANPNIIYLGDTSTVVQKGFYYIDGLTIDNETEGEPDNPPFYSNISDNEVTQVGEDVTVSCYWEDDFELDTCYVEHNSTGAYTNYSISVSGSSSWANKTFQLNFTANIKVGYKWFCSDNASQWNSTSISYIITTPLYVTFNHNNDTYGSFYADYEKKANQTQNSYNYNQSIFLLGVTYNMSYIWCNFTDGSETLTENEQNYYTSGNKTLWSYFDICNATGDGNGNYTETDLHEYFVLGALISGVCVFMVTIIVIDKKDLIRGK